MKYSGVIFDFNGTLFWDTPLHNKAWNIFLEKRGMHLSDHEFFATFHGKNNRDIFNNLFHREHSAEEIRALVDEKETLYRQLCLETEMMLAPGAPVFLDFLQKREIPFTIATASDKENVNFYFEHLVRLRQDSVQQRTDKRKTRSANLPDCHVGDRKTAG